MGSEYSKQDDFPFHNPQMIEVSAGGLEVARHPKFLMTPALGSCVGVALWDSMVRQGGLAHIMLPTTLDAIGADDDPRFASAAIPQLVRLLAEKGSTRRRLVAKIAGGAMMFASETSLATIGDRNVAETKRQLGLLDIPLVAEDTGGGHARTVELRLDTGLFVVRSYLYGIKEL